MKDLDLTTLRYFVAVCDHGNIAKAAHEQNLVASAISKRLGQLEGDLGVALLERRRRGVVPTAAGEALLVHAREMLATAHRVAQDVASLGTGPRGQVRLLATVSSIAERLPDDVAAFMQQPAHRMIKVDIEESLSRDIVRRIKDGSAALGVLWDATELQGLQSAPYRGDRLAVVVDSSHALAQRARCDFRDTLAYEHVGVQASSAVSLMLARAAALEGKSVNYRSQVSNFESSLRVVKAGLGISIIPREIAQAYAAPMGLKIVPLRDAWAERRFVICYVNRQTMPKAAGLLLDFLVASRKT